LPTQSVHIPGILVDAIVVAPNQMQTTQTLYDPALSGEVHRDLDDIEPVEFGLEKVIARRAAAELQVDAVVNLGFGISAAIPRVLLEEGHAEDVTWVIEQGAVGGFPATGFAFGCALNPQALVQSVDQFTLLQGGGFDVAMLSFLEVSGAGDVNVSYLAARPHVTAGVGGFNDIVTRASQPARKISRSATASFTLFLMALSQSSSRRSHRFPSPARWPASADKTSSTSPNVVSSS